MAKKSVNKINSKNSSQDDSKTYAIIAVLLSIIGFLIVLLSKKEDKYAMFYARESLVLFIAGVIASIISAILTWISFGFFYYIGWILWVLVIVLWIIQIINAASGQEKSTPIIGEFAKKFNL